MASKKAFSGSIVHAALALLAILLVISVYYIVGTRDLAVTVTSREGFVPGAAVQVNVGGVFYGSSTNTDGVAFFYGLPRGRDAFILVSKEGYADAAVSTPVDAANKQVVLSMLPEEMPPLPPSIGPA